MLVAGAALVVAFDPRSAALSGEVLADRPLILRWDPSARPIAILVLEVINYVEHYGMVRVPTEPVRPRHSWNCNHVVSGIFTYNRVVYWF